MSPRQHRPRPEPLLDRAAPAPAPAARLPLRLIRVCPECAGPVVRSSGCLTCRQCGWGLCE